MSREAFDKWLDGSYTKGIDNWAQTALWECWQEAERIAERERVTVTTNGLGEVVAVTITNEDHQVQRVIWER